MINKIERVIADVLKPNATVVFCGAGVSVNSGLPIVNQLIPYILQKLNVLSEDIKLILDNYNNLKLPFESFIELLSESTKTDQLYDIYCQGEPNTNHILLAKLAKTGIIKTIVTTNFDQLIEIALSREGLVEKKHFDVIFKEECFNKIDWSKERIRIIKIHGSVVDKDAMSITIKQVASQTLSIQRKMILDHVFSTGQHNKVLILGYSCSDVFDITPQIQSINGDKKEIVFIQHTQNIPLNDLKELEDLKMEYKNPFEEFSGVRIRCDTNSFIKEMWMASSKKLGDYKETRHEIDWKKCVDGWIDENNLGKENINSIVGNIFYKISDYATSIKYHEQALATKDIAMESMCYVNLGISYKGLGDYTKAINFFRQALEIDKTSEDKKGESICYINLGIAFEGLGDYTQTIKYYEQALELKRALNDNRGILICFIGMGDAYRKLGETNKATKYFEQALEISKVIVNKSLESRCYSGLGIIYSTLGNFDKALSYHEKALEISTLLGETIAEHYLNLGGIHYRRGDIYRAICAYEQALVAFKSQDAETGKAACYINLGAVYCDLKEFQISIEYYGQALDVYLKIGDKAKEAICYANLGNVYCSLRIFDKSISYQEQALRIYNTIGYKSSETNSYVGLGNAYYGLGDFNKATEYYLKSEKHAKEMDQFHALETIYRNLVLVYGKTGDIENEISYTKRLRELQKNQ